MQQHLLFRLYGPLSAWGDIAVGEQRPSSTHPSRSAILGLLAAALGLRRHQTKALDALNGDLRVAVRIDTPGEMLRDYHTTQAPVRNRKQVFRTRKDELSADKLHTILSQRDYRSDACYTVALWQVGDSSTHSLEQIMEALRKPRLTLYLGRKACPPALPLEPQLCRAETLKSAFDQSKFHNDLIANLPTAMHITYLWEYHLKPGLSALQVYPRRDNPLNRLRWQFSPRDEYHAMEEAPQQP